MRLASRARRAHCSLCNLTAGAYHSLCERPLSSSYQDELREAVIGPFSLAAEQLSAEQATQACQRFLPLLTLLSSSPSLSHHVSDSIDSLAGLYISSLSLTGKADVAKLNVLNLMLPSLSWLRAAVAVSVPREKPPTTQLSFLLRVYSLALNSLPASPSSVEYLRYEQLAANMLCYYSQIA